MPAVTPPITSADGVRAWVEATGWLAPVVFVVVYALLTVALVPGSLLTVSAGLLFGAGLGSPLALVGATTGATTAFAIARAAGRRAVVSLVAGRAERVDRWLGRRGVLVLLTVGGAAALRRQQSRTSDKVAAKGAGGASESA